MQQADRAHSATGTLASSGNFDEISRRAIFAGMAGAAVSLALAPTSAQATTVSDNWARQMAHHDHLKRRTNDLWTRYNSMPPSAREQAIGKEVEQASELESTAWTEMMTTPAPHMAALRWKLEQLLEIEGDGMSASWCERLVRPALADIARLMLPAA